MLEYLKFIKEAQLQNFRSMPVDKPAEEVKTIVTVAKSEYNFAYLFAELPTAVKEFKEREDQKQQQVEKKVAHMKAVQEGGEI